MLATPDCHDLDDGPRTLRSGAERMCAVTREVRPVEELVRFVVGPDGAVVADLKRRLPGRGLWISASRKAVAEAVRRGVFGRGFRRDVRAAPELADAVEALLERAVVDALAMAGKAGQVVAGFTKVETALRAGQAVAVLHAADGSADGIRKLDAILRQTAGSDRACPVFALVSSAQLDLALGRTNVIHAALRAGPAADTVVARCRGLVRYRGGADVREAAAASPDRPGASGPQTSPSDSAPRGNEAAASGASRLRDV